MNRDAASTQLVTAEALAQPRPHSTSEIPTGKHATRSTKPDVLYKISPRGSLPTIVQGNPSVGASSRVSLTPPPQGTQVIAPSQPTPIRTPPPVRQITPSSAPPAYQQQQPAVPVPVGVVITPPQVIQTPPPVAAPVTPPPHPVVPPVNPLLVPLPPDADSDNEMGEDKTVMPTAFSGKPDEDGDAWLRHFLNYCRYKEYNNDKSLALIRVLLAGNAALWFDSLPQATSTSFDDLQQAFNERYKTPEIMKFRSAKEIFSRRQQPNESCDDFIAHMLKLGRQINADDKMIRYAILNGLLPAISCFVTQQRPENMDRLLEAARLAELTSPPKQASDTMLSEQLADVQAEVKRLGSDDYCSRFRSPNPGRD